MFGANMEGKGGEDDDGDVVRQLLLRRSFRERLLLDIEEGLSSN